MFLLIFYAHRLLLSSLLTQHQFEAHPSYNSSASELAFSSLLADASSADQQSRAHVFTDFGVWRRTVIARIVDSEGPH